MTEPNYLNPSTAALADALVKTFGWTQTRKTPTELTLTRGTAELTLTNEGWDVTVDDYEADGYHFDDPKRPGWDASLAAWNLDDVLTSFEESVTWYD